MSERSRGDAAAPADSLKAQLAEAARRLGDRREAALLAAAALDQPLSWIYAHGDEPLRPEMARRFAELVDRRAAGIPFAYLVGRREFYGRDFSVSPDTLIPRPETEHLVEWALALPLPEGARAADIGTGSGCIALTLAAERPSWRVIGTDLSSLALAVAQVNRARLGCDNVELVFGDLLAPLTGREPFDVIVSNPPYVASDDRHLGEGDVRHEPRIALTPGPDALAVIRRLIDEAPDALRAGGWLLVEHGFDQGEAVRRLFADAGYGAIESRRDLAGIERVTGGIRPGSRR